MIAWKLKQLIASGIGSVIDLDRRIPPSGRYVFAYHRVIARSAADADHVHPAMWVSPEAFENHIAWMRSVGEIVDYHRLLDFERPSERPLFTLTFDDGWRDTFEIAFPVLRRLSVPALVFLVSAAVESGELFWPEDVVFKTHHRARFVPPATLLKALREVWPGSGSYPGRRPPDVGTAAEAFVEALKLVASNERSERIADFFRRIGVDPKPMQGYLMTWDHARTMQANGISFGSHTHTHTILKGSTEEEIRREAEVSRHAISENLQVNVDALCYPNARYDGTEGEILASLGYEYAFRIDGRAVTATDNPFYIPRFLVSQQVLSNGAYFRLHLMETPLFAGKVHDVRITRRSVKVG